MDIYYHLLTAWGFDQSGGYVGWDFWQYAPFGRTHIYPPFFHLVLSLFVKLNIDQVLLAKICECFIPVVFFGVLWRFVRIGFNSRLAFFVVIAGCSSFPLFRILTNHIPASLAIIFGLLALGQILESKVLRPALLLALCFYTHIGISWLFLITVFLYGVFNNEYKKLCLKVFFLVLCLSLPILFKELLGSGSIKSLGINLNETYNCSFKILEYILVILGLIFLTKNPDKRYRLFLSLFIASFILLSYPFRFFSGEGFLAAIFLIAVALEYLYSKLSKDRLYARMAFFAVIIYLLFISPKIYMTKSVEQKNITYGVSFYDTVLSGLSFPRGEYSSSIWFPEDYLSAARMIRENSSKDDIIFATINIAGVALGSLSGRATANGLFPEVKPVRKFDPVLNSRIIVTARDDDPVLLDKIISYYKLKKIGDNKLFVLYENQSCYVKADIKKATVPFWLIIFIGIAVIFLYWKAPFIEKQLLCSK